MPADNRPPHHMPVHASYPPPPGPGAGGGGYASQHPHPMHHLHPARHASNGPPPLPAGPPHMPTQHPGMPPPPPDAQPRGGPPANGHAHDAHGPMVIDRPGGADQEWPSQLAAANENTWMLVGAVSEGMGELDRALVAFQHALRHNPNSILGLNAVATIARNREDWDKAIEYYQRILNIKQDNGEVWGAMGHCLLMKDDLPKAYTAYQQALSYLQNPKEPKLWYGIGILYDRYGSFEHAEEAFSSVLKMDPHFDKANEIYFRLGIIYKHQRKYSHSLECFRYIIDNPPAPLTSFDIWFQLGHIYELDHDFIAARDAYQRVLSQQPDHAKVLQQLGWLYNQPGAPFGNQEQAVQYLTKSLETDGSDAQSWYLLGRAFMSGQRFNKAYEAYQQAVYRDGRNPTFWCSIGVLYFQINQYRDALDAYSRVIRLNPYISEVWYNLGILYESCNNQYHDAIDAYSRAQELDPSNNVIKQRIQMLINNPNAPLPPPPAPVDVHPGQYRAETNGLGPNGSPMSSPRQGNAPLLDGRDAAAAAAAQHGRDLPPPPGRQSPPPFRTGGAPPPLNHVDESRGSMSRHAPLAPIDTERPDPRDLRDSYRDAAPPYGGGMPPHGRFDPAAGGDRRRGPSPGSPRRRGSVMEGPPPPHGHAYHPAAMQARERDEWERRGGDPRDPRGMPPGPPRGPSPRPLERGGNPAMQRREHRPEGLPPYGGGFERGGPPGQFPPGFDPREQHRFEEQEKMGHPEFNGNHRQPSMPRDVLPPDLRAPSPAASTSSRASAAARRKVSDIKDKKAPAKRSDKRKPASEESPRPSPGPGPSTHPSSASRQTALPSRTVDEDYDEGAADALMVLASDRRGSKPTSPNATTGVKRATPPSPEPERSAPKKSKPSPPPAASPTRHTVIEVLNAPRVSGLQAAAELPGGEGREVRDGREGREVKEAKESDKAKDAEAAAVAESKDGKEKEAEPVAEEREPEDAAEASAPSGKAAEDVEMGDAAGKEEDKEKDKDEAEKE